MIDVSAIQSAVSHVQLAAGIAKGMLESKNAIDRQGQVIELQAALMAAQNSALQAIATQYELQEKVRSLEADLRAVGEWGSEQKRYSLVCPWHGAAQAYALRKDQARPDEAPH